MVGGSRMGVALLLVFLAAQTIAAQSQIATAFETVKVAEGIYAFIPPEPKSQLVTGNCVAIIGDDGVLVVDAGHFPGLAKKMIAEIRKVTDMPVKYLVNTHWHPDHWVGNSAFRDAFPNVTIVMHTFTREKLETYGRRYAQVAGERIPQMIPVIRDGLAAGKGQNGQPLDEFGKEVQKQLLADAEATVGEFKQARFEGANQTFEREMTIYLGKREIKIMNLGRGNTAGDAVIFVPDAKALITGDTVVSPTPYAFGSYFTEWIEVLKKMKAMNPSVIVPGHGDVQHDFAYLDTLIGLFESTLTQVQAAVKKGLTLEDTRKQIDLTSFEKKLAGDNPWRKGAFQIGFVQPGVERAYEELKYLKSE